MEIFNSLNPWQKKATINFHTSMLFWYYCFSLRLVNGSECVAFFGDEVLLSSHFCPHRLDFFPEAKLPPSRPHGAWLVEAHSLQLQSERRPTPSSLLRFTPSGPERRPTPSSISTVCIPLGCRFYFSSHSRSSLGQITHLPIFSHKKLLSLF